MNIKGRMAKLAAKKAEEEGKATAAQVLDQYHKERWAELSPELQRKAVAYLSDKLPPNFLTEVAAAHREYGPEWVNQIGKKDDPFYVFHMMDGMGVRNLLRDVILDKELPTGNWDDFYTQALEEAALESSTGLHR